MLLETKKFFWRFSSKIVYIAIEVYLKPFNIYVKYIRESLKENLEKMAPKLQLKYQHGSTSNLVHSFNVYLVYCHYVLNGSIKVWRGIRRRTSFFYYYFAIRFVYFVLCHTLNNYGKVIVVHAVIFKCGKFIQDWYLWSHSKAFLWKD